MIAPSLAYLAQLPLMKTYSTEELDKIQKFLLDGKMSEGLEWILEKKDYSLRRRKKVRALTCGYGQALVHFACIRNPLSPIVNFSIIGRYLITI